MPKGLRDAWFKIDARSLGLFRITFALALLADLLRRWSWLRDFYSNEGVLPNHNHIFNLRDQGQVWSLMHSFSSVDEARVGFLAILVFYLFFLVGYKTRAFQFVALICLWSLCSRNILAEGPGNYAGVAFAVFTLFLPLGKAFSVDAMLARMKLRDEKTDVALNDRAEESEAIADATRGPGWSPTSLAAFAVTIQIALMSWCTARAQSTPQWSDGSALYYALHTDRWVSSLGASLRSAPPAVLMGWTHALHGAEYAIPFLLLIPIAVRPLRIAAVVLNLFVGLTLTLLFALGLYGWIVLAITPLFISRETWERFSRPRKNGKVTVVYDEDCGVCIWLSRVVKRIDMRHHFTFVGNNRVLSTSDNEPKHYRDGGAPVDLPAEVTPEVVANTVVAVDEKNRVYQRAHAIGRCFRALPLGWTFSWIFSLPGMDALYDVFASRRQRVSVLMGKEACGIEQRHTPDVFDPPPAEVPPAKVLSRRVTGVIRDVLVAVILVAAFAQAGKAGSIPAIVPQPRALEAVAAWPRMLQRWDILGNVTTTNDLMIVDAVTRGGKNVDTLTGLEPDFDLSKRRGTGLGQMWNDYLDRIRTKEFSDFQKAFRDYLNRGGPKWDSTGQENGIQGYDTYWVHQEIPPPGGGEAQPSEREKLWTQARGGRNSGPNPNIPLVRPNAVKR